MTPTATGFTLELAEPAYGVAPGQIAALYADGAVVDPVPCPLPPGGATVHSGRTVHYAGPNTTEEPRRALIMAFAREPQPLAEPRSFFWQRPEWSQ